MASISHKQLFEAVHSAGLITNIEMAYDVCLGELRVHYNVGDEDNIPQQLLKNTSDTIKQFLYRLRKKWYKCGS